MDIVKTIEYYEGLLRRESGLKQATKKSCLQFVIFVSIRPFESMTSLNRNIIFIFLLVLFRGTVIAQLTPLDERLYDEYLTFKDADILNRRFSHDLLVGILDKKSSELDIEVIGKSVEGRSINVVRFGSGQESVLLWSQMHGNESTATMALTDVFNFLTSKGDGFEDVRNTIKEKLSVYFVPMLNPDGASRFERRNQQGIDINRDALRLQTPEGRTLKKIRNDIEADWGFNLHDQGRTTAVGDLPATISLLAPAYDFDRSVNEKRKNAIQVSAEINEILQRRIPNQVGRYWDDFEPRAFGDNIQKWGTRTILIESGGYQQDREKQEIRRLNFTILIASLYSIATSNYKKFEVDDYLKIPNNTRGIRDVIIGGVVVPDDMGGHLTDIAFNFNERPINDQPGYFLEAAIADLGDLSTSGAYLKYDVNKLIVKRGLVYDMTLKGDIDFSQANWQLELLKEGYTDLLVDNVNRDYPWSTPLKRVETREKDQLQIGSNPSLLFYDGPTLQYVLVNGYFFNPSDGWNSILAGLRKL